MNTKRAGRKLRARRADEVREATYLKFRTRWRHVLAIDQEIRSGSAPNCTDLAEKLEVCRRTVLRDIDFLRYDLGAPVEYDPSRRGYIYTEPSWTMPNVRVNEGELFALMVAEKALEAYAGTPWAQKLQRVFERMLASLPDRIEVAPGELLPRVEFAENWEARVSPEIIATVSAALTCNETLRISYCRLGDEKPRDYVVDPYVLRRAAGAWYLVGLDHKSGYIPLFNLTRIASAQPTGETFDYGAAKFFPKEYFRDTFRAFQSREKVRVVVEFSGIAAALVRERHWHASQKLTDLPGGGLRFEAEVSHLDDIWPWVLSWGAGAKVVAPKEFAAQVVEELKQAAVLYADR